jgi:hypothetical protein
VMYWTILAPWGMSGSAVLARSLFLLALAH